MCPVLLIWLQKIKSSQQVYWGLFFSRCQLLSKESSTVLYQASPRRMVSVQTLNMQATLRAAHVHSSKSNNEQAVVSLVGARPHEDTAICIRTARHGMSCSSLIKNTSTKPSMWSTCLFTTITSQEMLKGLQSWRHSCVKCRGDELMPCNAQPCRGGCAPSTCGQIQTPGLPCRNAREWLQQTELPFALHLWACEQPEQRACLVTKRQEGEWLRWEPDVHLQLYQLQPTFCTIKSHCRWWQWGERLERVAGHSLTKTGHSLQSCAATPLGCQPVGCQQRKSFHA